MALISPFRGLLYDPAKVGGLSQVIAPPYDVIAPSEQRALYDRHPANIVRVELGLDEPGDDERRNRYTRAAECLERWQSEGILVRDAQPAFYGYRQAFRVSGEPGVVARLGFFALVRLEESGSATIRPHERTLEGPKADRFALMRACHANLSPIFALLSDPTGEIAAVLREAVLAAPEPLSARDDAGVAHELWRLKDPAVMRRLVEGLRPGEIFIADGHHRYETARNWRDHLRSLDPAISPLETCNYVLMYLTPMEDPGLKVLPSHRWITKLGSFDRRELLQRLAGVFRIETIEPTDPEAIRRVLAEAGRKGRAIGLALPAEPVRILHLASAEALDRLRAAGVTEAALSLDVVLLHRLVIEEALGISLADQAKGGFIEFGHEMAEVLDEVKTGRARAAFLLNPTRIEQVREIASRGEIMPQKSTYFYPKLASGLVIHPVLPGEQVPALP